MLAACGGGAPKSPLQTVRGAANATLSASSAQMVETVKTQHGSLAGGLTYNGGVDFSVSRSRVQFNPSADAPGNSSATTVDAVIDFSHGLVTYVHLPKAEKVGGKPWIKVDYATIAGPALDFSAVVRDTSGDPAASVALLAGAASATDFGSQTIRGTRTTHYRAGVDLTQAAANAPAKVRSAISALAGMSVSKMLTEDVWIDSKDRVRQLMVTIDPAQLHLPATDDSVSSTGTLSVTLDLFSFGSPVDVVVPVGDVGQLPTVSGVTGI